MPTIPDEELLLTQLSEAARRRRETLAEIDAANKRLTATALAAVESNVSRYKIARIAGLTWGAINRRLRKEGWEPPHSKQR